MLWLVECSHLTLHACQVHPATNIGDSLMGQQANVPLLSGRTRFGPI